jgi:hypothetical protein
MSTAKLIKEETGEIWSLESHHDCVKGFYLAPGAKKPKLTRVPKNLCTDGDPDKHVDVWQETLKSRGFALEEEDKTPADPEVTIRWSIEGLVEMSWLPADLQKIADAQQGIIHIPGKSDQPITMFDNSTDGQVSNRKPMLAGTITVLEDLVVLLRLAKALKEHQVEVLGMLDTENPDSDGEAVTMTPDNGAEKAANWWPELRPKLEEHDLVRVPVQSLEKSAPSRKWFF